MDKKKVTVLAKKMIKEGQNKQEVYNQLVDEYHERKTIADIIRYIPSPEKLKKYGIWNALFLTFIIGTTSAVLLTVPSFSLAPLLIFVALVAFKQFKYYYWSVFFGIVLLIIGTIGNIYNYLEKPSDFQVMPLIAICLLGVIFIFAGTYLPKKIIPNYREEKEKYTASNGQTKIRLKHYFDN